MKRILIIALVAVMSLSLLAGCSAAKPVYKDGTYTAYSDANDKGDYSAVVTIKGDKITDVKVQGYTGLGQAKEASYVWAEYHQAVTDLPKRFVEKNTWDVDAVAKATATSNGAKQAVLRAMQKALVTPTTSAKYFDGTYMAMSETTDKGWTVVWVTISGDKITKVDLHATTPAKEKDAEGNVLKGEDGKDVIKKNAAGNVVFERKDPAVYGLAAGYTAYAEAKVELPKRFVAKNGADIDVYTLATGTSNQAKEAVAKALANAAR
ncbi:MAG: FMN-binding domain-containing protein [Bacillota bacterium]|nr:MAG: FMN-binding domain-containing protein [Bacillota bacterium]